MKFQFVTDDGPIEMALIDGYSVGDRLLEGVMFECRFTDDGTIAVNVCANDASYLDDLAGQKWIERITEYANERDGEDFNCDSFQDGLGNDAWVESVDGKFLRRVGNVTPVQIAALDGPDFLRKLIEQKKK